MLDILIEDLFYRLLKITDLKSVIRLSQITKTFNQKITQMPITDQLRHIDIYKRSNCNNKEDDDFDIDIFLHACILGHLDLVQSLYQTNPNIETISNTGMRLAIEHDHRHIVKYLSSISDDKYLLQIQNLDNRDLIKAHLELANPYGELRNREYRFGDKLWNCYHHYLYATIGTNYLISNIVRNGMVAEEIYVVTVIDWLPKWKLKSDWIYHLIKSVSVVVGGMSIVTYDSETLRHIDAITDNQPVLPNSKPGELLMCYPLQINQIFNEMNYHTDSESRCNCFSCSYVKNAPGIRLSYLQYHEVKVRIEFGNARDLIECLDTLPELSITNSYLYTRYIDFDMDPIKKEMRSMELCSTRIHQALNYWVKIDPMSNRSRNLNIFTYFVDYRHPLKLFPYLVLVLKTVHINYLININMTFDDHIYDNLSWSIIKNHADYSYLELCYPPDILTEHRKISDVIVMCKTSHDINLILLAKINNVGQHMSGMFGLLYHY